MIQDHRGIIGKKRIPGVKQDARPEGGDELLQGCLRWRSGCGDSTRFQAVNRPGRLGVAVDADECTDRDRALRSIDFPGGKIGAATTAGVIPDRVADAARHNQIVPHADHAVDGRRSAGESGAVPEHRSQADIARRRDRFPSRAFPVGPAAIVVPNETETHGESERRRRERLSQHHTRRLGVT